MNWIIIAGLGNPGRQYESTKHNVGFKVLDKVANNYNETWKEFKKSGKMIAIKKKPTNILLYKPLTFMNNSGQSLVEVMDYFSIATESLFLIHDEKGLPLGTIKYSTLKGHNGHNGVANVIHMMQSKDFMRARFGIGSPFLNQPLDQYVLSPFPKQGKSKVNQAITKMSNDICKFIEDQDFRKLQNNQNNLASS